ncbi:Tn3 family transposase, partial [Shigella sonnei]
MNKTKGCLIANFATVPLRAQGETLNDEDIARLSPLCHGHINMLGHYSFT